MDNSFWNMIWPIVMVVFANILYHICAKSMPNNTNPFFSLIFTYITASIITVILCFLIFKPENFAFNTSYINLASILLGLSIVIVEVGYILMYKAGWKISNASIIANICLQCSLLVIGVLVYHEEITLKQLAGVFICIFGLFLLTNN